MSAPTFLSEQARGAGAPADRFAKLIGLIGVPRSGTTVATAVLSVHSQISGVYEPWNANRQRVDASRSMSYDSFVDTFVRADQQGPVLLVKETATELRYLHRMRELLSDAPEQIGRQLIVMLRNPFHVFLSEVQARREWWGAEDLVVDEATFARWSARTLESFRLIAEIVLERDTLLISYEQFSRERHAVCALTRALGLEPEPAQLEFDKHLDRSAVRGDNRVAKEPRPVSGRSVEHRTAEFERLAEQLSSSPYFARIRRWEQAFAHLPVVSRGLQHDALMRELAKI